MGSRKMLVTWQLTFSFGFQNIQHKIVSIWFWFTEPGLLMSTLKYKHSFSRLTLVSESRLAGSAGMVISTVLVSTQITPTGIPPNLTNKQHVPVLQSYLILIFIFYLFNFITNSLRISASHHSIWYIKCYSKLMWFTIVIKLHKLSNQGRQTLLCL